MTKPAERSVAVLTDQMLSRRLVSLSDLASDLLVDGIKFLLFSLRQLFVHVDLKLPRTIRLLLMWKIAFALIRQAHKVIVHYI